MCKLIRGTEKGVSDSRLPKLSQLCNCPLHLSLTTVVSHFKKFLRTCHYKMASDYKKQKVAFVSNLTGSTIGDINSVALTMCVRTPLLAWRWPLANCELNSYVALFGQCCSRSFVLSRLIPQSPAWSTSFSIVEQLSVHLPFTHRHHCSSMRF